MTISKKEKIDNKFFDLISYIISFILSSFRSLKILLWFKEIENKWKFFKFFNFLFIIWPKYFWKKPNLYKIFSMPEKFIDYLFYKK